MQNSTAPTGRTAAVLGEPRLADLRRRTTAKWRAYPPDVLPLWVAEMDFAPCDPVVDAVTAAMRSGDTGYDYGCRYGFAYAGFAERRWGWTFDPTTTRTLPDVMSGIATVLRQFAGPGDVVVVSPPVYPPFYAFPAHEGLRVVEAPLGADGRLDLAVIEATFAAGASVYLLCNPHNPTGVAPTPTELSALLALARRYGVRVVADEIHAPLVDPARHTPLLSVEGSDDAVVVFSASKAWNVAGLRAAVAIAGPGAEAQLAAIPEIIDHGVDHLAVIAHEAALTAGEPWLDAVNEALAVNRTLLASLIAERLPAINYVPAPATYLAWLDCRGLPGPAGTDPGRFFLDEARVALNDGPTFGRGGAGHVRLNLATGRTILTEAIDRMAAAVRRIGA